MDRSVYLSHTRGVLLGVVLPLLLALLPALSVAQGLPRIRNFTNKEYGAHNRNFDITIGDDGTVFVANFEGLLYYDRAQWRVIHTPNISRITSLYRSADNTVWVGGHDFYGRILRNANGSLALEKMQRAQVPDAVQHNEADSVMLQDVLQTLNIGQDMVVRVRNAKGIEVTDRSGCLLYSINESNGLCSDQVAKVAYDGHGLLWGATVHGVFCIELPSAYSYLAPKDGVSGEVHAITLFDGSVYVGGSNGLYVVNGQKAVRIPQINNVCWALCHSEGALLAATSSGVYRIAKGGGVSRTTPNSATAVMADGDKVYVGEPDGVYMYVGSRMVEKVNNMPLVTNISLAGNGQLFMRNVHGQTSLPGQHNAPAVSFTDNTGISWNTDELGKRLSAYKGGQRIADFDRLLAPLTDVSVGAIFRQGNSLWVGSDELLTIIQTDKGYLDSLAAHPAMRFRQIVMRGDSVIWGGFGKMPYSLPDIDSDYRHLWFSYALQYAPLSGRTLYRYRLNDEPWSQWSENNNVEFLNLPYGSFTLSVQARLANGSLSEVASVSWRIQFPFFMRWYMLVLYFLLFVLLVYAAFRYRLIRLRRDKKKLELVVRERTDEVARQKDELLRQEKMASVGKLTKGLIDRILNPMNYIINFSKMSAELARDVKANVEDNKEGMNREDYDDTLDALHMLSDNLNLIDQYGQNTSRILKAMEEMLKDRTTGYKNFDLLPVLQQMERVVANVYAADIEKYHIRVSFSLPSEPMTVYGSADLISQTLMGLLSNAVYAVVRKAQKTPYDALVSLSARDEQGRYVIAVSDNGVGIEQTILDKIFDPFFTTKTTGEAAGVGLYLGKEIIQNHQGDISVRSEKDKFTEFTISLPHISVS